MKIDQIKISNFRSYKGLVKIDFDNSSENRNITLISGKNGFGKTSFLTSLIWGFYGKLMSKVEDKYKHEIKNSGGYEKYLNNQFNRNQNKENHLRVEIIISEILIPSIPCNNITIKRAYNTETSKENLEILIDGKVNELTKKVGFETFINDFILPREIAKFFFFDSEKIVSLAEAKTRDELKSLSKAYSEVLGLKKYDDLKLGLKSLISSLKRKGVDESINFELDKLYNDKVALDKEIDFNDETLKETNMSIEDLRIKSDNLQEKLIREGSTISLDEFKYLKEESELILNKLKENRRKLNQHLEFMPFLISNDLFKNLVDQIKSESKSGNSILEKDKLKQLTKIYKSSIKELPQEQIDAYSKSFLEDLNKSFGRKSENKVLLDYTDETNRKILSVFDNVQGPLIKEYQSIDSVEKEWKFQLMQIQKKIRSFESKTNNPLSNSFRKEKEELDNQIENLLIKKGELSNIKSDLSIKKASLMRRISELESKQKVVGQDSKKLHLSQKVYDKLSNITEKIKVKKKYSLEKSILIGMNSLMHKSDFIERVSIEIFEDYLDINLIDKSGNKIDKESLSKGEQQLYATSILKSLVEESGINFPIFVDSPLQKFDKEHSENIIRRFYPSISKQVVLFPLMEKELTFDEFKLMETNITSIHMIINKEGNSNIEKIDNIKLLFE